MATRPLLMATMNRHKLEEVRNILDNSGLMSHFTLKDMHDVGFTGDIPEVELTLEGNARAKSMVGYNLSGFNCFADDTGLEVTSLGGAPGVHSARYAGEDADARKNIDRLLSELKGFTNRKARFRTVISLLFEGDEFTFEGVVEGEILTERRGVKGFGYDPVFRPNGYSVSFGIMDAAEKNRISHRYQAIRKMATFLKQQINK